MTFFYFSATRSTPSAQKCGGTSPSGGVPQSVHSQPQTAADSPKSSMPYRNHTRKEKPLKRANRKRRKGQPPEGHTSQPTPPTMGDPTTAHPTKRKHRQQSRQRWTCTTPGNPPPAKSKRKAPRRTGAHDVIFLIGLLEDFTQQNERKKNNTHDQKHFYTSSILSL